jgi:Gamma interferon inducible lysosomal thiol reductase (GILT)
MDDTTVKVPVVAIQQSQQQEPLQPNPSLHRKEPVEVRIYLESLCIDSQRFMNELIIPTYAALYGNSDHDTFHTTQQRQHVADLNIIMFGNTRYNSKRQQQQNRFTCQHGIAECDLNSYSLCVQALYGNNIHVYLPFMMCLYDGHIPMGYHNETYPSSMIATCATQAKIDFTFVVQKCYSNTTMVQALQYKAYQETLITNHTYVPWVTFNDRHDAIHSEDNMDLLSTICDIYYNHTANTTSASTFMKKLKDATGTNANGNLRYRNPCKSISSISSIE